MTVVTPDLVNGHSYTKILSGFEIKRVYRVSELIEVPERQLIEASLDPGVPQLGTTYPGTTGINAVRHEVAPAGPNAAFVTVIYSARNNISSFNQPEPVSNDGQDVKQISAGVREVTTTRDITDTAMELTAPAQYKTWQPYLSEARVFKPVGGIVFERVEKSPAVFTARDMVGKLNSAAIGEYGIKTLLFFDLDAQSDDGGNLWNCVYTFRYDADQWVHKDRYHGPQGKVGTAAVEMTWEVLQTANFSTLNLDFSASQTPIS